MMVTLTQVPNKHVVAIWPQVLPHLMKGAEYWETHYDQADLMDECVKGNMQLWVQIIDKKIKTILLTQLISYPKCIYLRYTYVGGENLRVAVKYVYMIETWAKSHGAIGYELLGRPQWSSFVTKNKFGEPRAAVWLSGLFEDQ